ncbi:xylan glycosyltransferase MUCI21-like [Rhodamnia argentea]|uniref:Xylan glycosyltransferase MUCI21-like n=1 Tax=Rhodamnia argentea TaxID=178133 RepID=A0ABM3GRV3_9MYRT|nr:xylan glycosyltransferase MUCI21-like [Rhodamnia argentea]
MVQRQRFHQLRKGEPHAFDDEEGHGRKKPKLFYLLLLLSLLSCSFVVVPQLFGSSSHSLYSFGGDREGGREDYNANAPPCSSMSNGTICCDRSGFRSDVCIMKGDVRTHSPSSSVFLYLSKQPGGFDEFISSVHRVAGGHDDEELQHEKIRPYTRKWENIVMDKIDQLDLIVKKDTMGAHHRCDVWHDVPALLFSTGGYTGNLYHEFNDGILPLYITSQHFKKEVVFIILEYHHWWFTKYENIVSRLSNYPPIDFSGDNRTHCFPEAIVGLKIHDEFTVDPSLMKGNKSILDFRHFLDSAYQYRIKGSMPDKERGIQLKLNQSASVPASGQLMNINKNDQKHQLKKPKLVIISRSGSRALVNEDCLVTLAEEVGFRVEVSRPGRTTDLANMYHLLNESEVMVGVHGAALTHFLFLKPGSVFIQVIPLGTDSPAEACFGKPARELGLKYIGYKILPRESSLYNEYDKGDPVLTNPKTVNKKGWQYTKEIYLERQNVSLDMTRFHKRLLQAYDYSFKKINGQISYSQTTKLFNLC